MKKRERKLYVYEKAECERKEGRMESQWDLCFMLRLSYVVKLRQFWFLMQIDKKKLWAGEIIKYASRLINKFFPTYVVRLREVAMFRWTTTNDVIDISGRLFESGEGFPESAFERRWAARGIFCRFLRSFPTFPQSREGCVEQKSEKSTKLCRKELIKSQKRRIWWPKYVNYRRGVPCRKNPLKFHAEKVDHELKSRFEIFHFSSFFTVHFSVKKRRKNFIWCASVCVVL